MRTRETAVSAMSRAPHRACATYNICEDYQDGKEKNKSERRTIFFQHINFLFIICNTRWMMLMNKKKREKIVRLNKTKSKDFKFYAIM